MLSHQDSLSIMLVIGGPAHNQVGHRDLPPCSVPSISMGTDSTAREV